MRLDDRVAVRAPPAGDDKMKRQTGFLTLFEAKIMSLQKRFEIAEMRVDSEGNCDKGWDCIGIMLTARFIISLCLDT